MAQVYSLLFGKPNSFLLNGFVGRLFQELPGDDDIVSQKQVVQNMLELNYFKEILNNQSALLNLTQLELSDKQKAKNAQSQVYRVVSQIIISYGDQDSRDLSFYKKKLRLIFNSEIMKSQEIEKSLDDWFDRDQSQKLKLKDAELKNVYFCDEISRDLEGLREIQKNCHQKKIILPVAICQKLKSLSDSNEIQRATLQQIFTNQKFMDLVVLSLQNINLSQTYIEFFIFFFDSLYDYLIEKNDLPEQKINQYVKDLDIRGNLDQVSLTKYKEDLELLNLKRINLLKNILKV